MPRKPEMTWVPGRCLWRKMYRGKVYTISCRQLRELGFDVISDTKEGSYPAANAWWHKKAHELWEAEQRPARPPLPLEDLAQVLQPDLASVSGRAVAIMAHFLKLRAERRAAGEEIEAEAEDDDADLVPPVPPGPDDDPNQMFKAVIEATVADVLKRTILGGEPVPAEVAAQLPPARVQQLQDGVKAIRGEPTANPEKTVAAHVETWVKGQQARVRAGVITAGRCAATRCYLEPFATFLGPQADVTTIDASKVEGFYNYCLAKIRTSDQPEGWAVSYAREVFEAARRFVKWLWEQGRIELPRNMGARFPFGSTTQKIKTWEVGEFQTAVQAATGKLRLCLLLCANCGMTQKDVSDLRDEEVDWAAGRIIRKRSKTTRSKNVPVVCYKLWPQTFQLLQEHRSGGERVLLTKYGQPYLRSELRADGKLRKCDAFKSNYDFLRQRLGLKHPLKGLRKLGASLLATHRDYGRFASYFLGHSPQSVADRHYVVPPQELFDEAVLWLGRQLGQVQ
jgi:integrase